MFPTHFEEATIHGEGQLEQDVEREDAEEKPREKGKEQVAQEEIALPGPVAPCARETHQ